MIRLLMSFHQKLLLPTFCCAVGIGFAGYCMIWSTPIIEGTGFGYIVAGPLTHYFTYDIKNENEYYFYFNSGLNKLVLYASTVTINLIIGGLILYYA